MCVEVRHGWDTQGFRTMGLRAVLLLDCSFSMGYLSDAGIVSWFRAESALLPHMVLSGSEESPFALQITLMCCVLISTSEQPHVVYPLLDIVSKTPLQNLNGSSSDRKRRSVLPSRTYIKPKRELASCIIAVLCAGLFVAKDTGEALIVSSFRACLAKTRRTLITKQRLRHGNK